MISLRGDFFVSLKILYNLRLVRLVYKRFIQQDWSSLTSEGFLFLSACLGRVQLTRYKGRQKHKAKIGKLTKKLQFLGDFIFFAKCLGRVQLSMS